MSEQSEGHNQARNPGPVVSPVTINMGCRFILAHTHFTPCKHDLQSLQGVNIIYKLYSCAYPRPRRDPHLNWLPAPLAQANNEIAFRQSWAASGQGWRKVLQNWDNYAEWLSVLASQCEGVSVVACGPTTGPCPASRRPISQGYLVHDTTAAGVTDDGDPGDSLLLDLIGCLVSTL